MFAFVLILTLVFSSAKGPVPASIVMGTFATSQECSDFAASKVPELAAKVAADSSVLYSGLGCAAQPLHIAHPKTEPSPPSNPKGSISYTVDPDNPASAMSPDNGSN
jgi:hypothetical protein